MAEVYMKTLFRYQVPELGFESDLTSSLQSGTSCLEPVTLKEGLTDLDTLLSDITAITDNDIKTSSMDTTTTFRMLDFQTPFQDEVTFYDDPLPINYKKEKIVEDYSFVTMETEQKPLTTQQSVDLACDLDLEKARREVDFICVQLDIQPGKSSFTLIHQL